MDKNPVRKDIRDLSPPELDVLVRGFKAIMDLDPSNPDSFFAIASHHGLPNRPQFCQHRNILFPVWHRAYLLRLENAIRNTIGRKDFALPFWNETSDQTLDEGLPTIFTEQVYIFSDGSDRIDNPLFSYTCQKDITNSSNVFKPKGYKTVRYPYAGMNKKLETAATAKEYNDRIDHYSAPQHVTRILNENIKFNFDPKRYQSDASPAVSRGVADYFKECLDVKDYAVFSNTKSAARWNDDRKSKPTTTLAVSLESPHDWVHVSLGARFWGATPAMLDLKDASGDMSINETAAFDPVFYFHHCFVDYTFWKWQVAQQQTTELKYKADPNDAGQYEDSQRKIPLDLGMTPLKPFKPEDGVAGQRQYGVGKVRACRTYLYICHETAMLIDTGLC
jgi:tyrosinase